MLGVECRCPIRESFAVILMVADFWISACSFKVFIFIFILFHLSLTARNHDV
jgi:hypothetical protein